MNNPVIWSNSREIAPVMLDFIKEDYKKVSPRTPLCLTKDLTTLTWIEVMKIRFVFLLNYNSEPK